MKLRTIIIDDEPLACMLLQDMLSAFDEVEVIAVCQNGFEGLEQISKLLPDLIFVDIQMPKITGVEMIELLEEKPMIVFSTAYDQYAIKAFEMNAVDYLLKPYDEQRVGKTIEKAKERALFNQPTKEILLTTPESVERIVVKENGDIKIIPIGDITHIEAAGDYIKIFTEKKFHIKHGKISHYETILNKVNFVRNHRSYLINIKYLTELEQTQGSYVAVLRNGTKLPVSKTGYDIIKKTIF